MAEGCEGNRPKGFIPKQDTPDDITDGWEDRLVLATWYTEDYQDRASKLRESAARHFPSVRFISFEFEPPIPGRRASIFCRPLQMRRLCDVIPDDKSVLWVDADHEIVRKPTRKELAHLIGYEGCDRFATSRHKNITNHYSPCLSTVLFRGPVAHKFIHHWADTVVRFWDDYMTGHMKDDPTCNASFNLARSRQVWKKSDLFDGSLSRVWNSTSKHPADNPIIINA